MLVCLRRPAEETSVFEMARSLLLLRPGRETECAGETMQEISIPGQKKTGWMWIQPVMA